MPGWYYLETWFELYFKLVKNFAYHQPNIHLTEYFGWRFADCCLETHVRFIDEGNWIAIRQFKNFEPFFEFRRIATLTDVVESTFLMHPGSNFAAMVSIHYAKLNGLSQCLRALKQLFSLILFVNSFGVQFERFLGISSRCIVSISREHLPFVHLSITR